MGTMQQLGRTPCTKKKSFLNNKTALKVSASQFQTSTPSGVCYLKRSTASIGSSSHPETFNKTAFNNTRKTI